MPPTPASIPPHLATRAFAVAEGRTAGLTVSAMRQARLRSPFHGARTAVARPTGPESITDIVRRAAHDYLPLLRTQSGELFSHTTALVLYGAPIRLRDQRPHVTIPRPHGPVRRTGMHGHNAAVMGPSGSSRHESLLPCVAPTTAFIQSGPLLSFRELVVAADHLIRWWNNYAIPPIVPHEELVESVQAWSGRGAHRIRAALEVARVGAESRMESLMHFELARHGIDVLELQAVLTSPTGEFIGRFDGMRRARRKILEYDGEQHRTDRSQYLRDESRLEAARNLGFSILRLHKEDFTERALAATATRMCHFLELQAKPVAPRLQRYFAERHW